METTGSMNGLSKHSGKIGIALIIIGSLFALPAQAQVPDEALAEIDEVIQSGAFDEAMSTLKQLDTDYPSTASILWRLSRVHVDIGEQTDSKKDKERWYRDALQIAEDAFEADSSDADVFLTLAIAMGRVALVSGTREKVERSRSVKENIDAAIGLDPANDASYHVRARWHYEVSSLGLFARTIVKVVYGGLPTASYEMAAQDYQLAIQHKDQIIHRLELGRTYIKLGENDRAREHLEKALSMPLIDPDDPMHQTEARELLNKAR